jgi:hypothetical protein
MTWLEVENRSVLGYLTRFFDKVIGGFAKFGDFLIIEDILNTDVSILVVGVDLVLGQHRHIP